uniref:Uncharacterized protein n=2 Tax=Lutzomyia longipalpis TaxID=7200 RepID=A0A1B0CSW5_LUTLO
MVFWRRNDKMSFKEIILILLILCELFSECCGKWCTVTETEYVVEKKLIKVTKYRKIAVKCNWYSMQKDCHKRVPYQDQEYVSNYVPKTVEKKVCCTGYNEELGECKPICEKACLNAKCISPNTCKCNNGYKIFSEHAPHRCIPSCSGCEFGSCVAPEVCNCASGYKRAPIYHQSKCIPYCRDECPRGSTCSQPDTCTCLPGYREIYREDKLKCLGEGETEEPPTTTTELTTTESTTTTTERTTTTTQLPTTERITTTELPTTETSTTEASNLRINNTPTSTSTSTEPESTTAKEDSTDYSEIEEVPAEDPTNSTILVQIHKAEIILQWKLFPMIRGW